jgi:hypothetical protein
MRDRSRRSDQYAKTFSHGFFTANRTLTLSTELPDVLTSSSTLPANGFDYFGRQSDGKIGLRKIFYIY